MATSQDTRWRRGGLLALAKHIVVTSFAHCMAAFGTDSNTKLSRK
jgi:hypothetical protein